MSPTPTTQGTRSPRVVLTIAFVALVFEGYDLTMYGTVVPSLLSDPEWNLSPDTAGRIGSAAVFGMLLGALLTALLNHRVMRRSLMMVSVAVLAAGMAASTVSGSAVELGASRLFVGIGVGILMPTTAALVIEFSPPGRRARNTAIGFAGIGIGGCLAGLLGAWIVPTYGFRPMFLLGAVPALVFLPAVWRSLPHSPAQLFDRGRTTEATQLADHYGLDLVAADPGAPASTFWSDVRALFGPAHRGAMVLFCLVCFLCMLLMFGAGTWLPTLMIASGYGVSSALALLIVLNLGATVGALGASAIADRIGLKIVVVAVFGIGAASFWLLGLRPVTVLVILLVALVGLGSTGAQVLLNAYVGSHFEPRLRTTALGLSMAVGRLGGIIGPLYGAALVADFSPSSQFTLWAIPGLVATALAWLLPRDHGTRVPAVADTEVTATR